MKSSKRGKYISNVEILNISPYGIWILILQKEYFLDFKNYPWFKQARLQDILDVKLYSNHHLHWASLDIDLDLESLENPEQHPLVYHP